MKGKTVVIVGAGTGGIVLANALRGQIGGAHRIIVVERSETHAFAPSFLWLMVGQRQRHEITRPVRKLLAHGIDVVIGEAGEIDAVRRLLRVGSETIAYDYLVLASGAEMRSDFASTETFFTLDGAERLYGVLREFRGGNVAVAVTSTPYKCPGAPAEGAMLIADFLRSKGVSARVDLYTPELRPMAVAGPQLGEAVKSMLAERGVGYRPQHTLRGVTEGSLQFEGRDPQAADLVITIPHHLPSPVVQTAGIANAAGWAVADPRTLLTKDAAITAIGDCTSMPLPGRWQPDTPLFLPKAGVFAHAQALAVADRLAATLNERSDAPVFHGEGFCMLEAGRHQAGFAYGEFYAEPSPDVRMREVGKTWHVSKILFEKWWLREPGLGKRTLGAAMALGGRLMGIPASF